jgi:hypothetical protein
MNFLHGEFLSEIFPVGAGVLIIDFDNDGFQDIYLPNSVGPNSLFHNNGDGTFTDVAAAAGVQDEETRGNGGCAADYDNDGYQDIYLSNYGSSKLYRNQGDGTFTDVTLAAGLDAPDDSYRSTGCAWGDYDQDGLLDLVVVHYLHEWTPAMFGDRDQIGAIGALYRGVRDLSLFHNDGDGTFTDATQLLGSVSAPVGGFGSTTVGNVRGAGFQPGWVDFDNDGDLDLYVVNDFGAELQPNVLWRNEGGFFDISVASSTDLPIYGMGLAVGDYDLDGFLDIFVTNIGENVLLKNNGDGLTFTDTTRDAGVGLAMIGVKERVTWGAVFFDYDNDGDEDLYVVSGFLKYGPADTSRGDIPDYLKEQPNALMRNEGDGRFEDVSYLSGAGDPGVGRGGVFLDFNNDGCLDLLVGNLGQRAKLFQNLCESGNSWLLVDPVGTVSNRDGIGARITLVTGGKTQIREVSSGRSNMGQNMLEVHFGLGGATLVDSVTIRWPSGTVQTLTDVAANQRLTVVEPR